jgi:hypothetical protein
MLKLSTTVTVVVFFMFSLAETAQAQFRGTPSGHSGTGGRCNIGTCAKGGGELARDVKNCSASNCKNPQGSNTKSK